MARRYTVSDGKMVLTLERAREGGFVVTSPLEPALITEADSLTEAFKMARDAMRTLRAPAGSVNAVILRYAEGSSCKRRCP